MLPAVLELVVVPRLDGGPSRCNPGTVIADNAYSAASNRSLLRGKRIRAVIPERADQIASRKRRGRAGGRPPGFDTVIYKRRNVVERAFNRVKHWRAVATRYDSRSPVAADSCWPASSDGSNHQETQPSLTRLEERPQPADTPLRRPNHHSMNHERLHRDPYTPATVAPAP